MILQLLTAETAAIQCRVCQFRIPNTTVFGLCKGYDDIGDLEECGVGYNSCIEVKETYQGFQSFVRACFKSTRDRGCIAKVKSGVRKYFEGIRISNRKCIWL